MSTKRFKPIPDLVRVAREVAKERSIKPSEVEAIRTGSQTKQSDSYQKSREIDKRILNQSVLSLSDNIEGIGEGGALQLLATIGALLAQYWGEKDRLAVREFNDYVVRRKGRANMRRKHGTG